MKLFDYKIIFLLLCAMSLASCKTAMLYTTLDILRPAQVSFADDVENLLIVNNSAVQPEVLGHTTRLLNGQPQKVAVSTDSTAVFCLSVLSEEMAATGFFESIDLQLEPENDRLLFNSITPLQRSTVKQLCEAYDVDAVLALDHIVVNDDLAEYYDYEWGTYLAALDVRMETLWSVHYPDRAGATAVHFKDSLFWESESYTRKEAFEDLPDRQDAIIDAALWVGQNSAKRFIPYWEKSDRYFYDPSDKQMKQGMDSVYVKNWEGAIDQWLVVYRSTKKSKLKAQVANNIAIAYEVIGDYDKAIEYASQAFDIFATQLMTYDDVLLRQVNYVTELNRRKKEIQLLNKQLAE